jgi:hypothetical protein
VPGDHFCLLKFSIWRFSETNIFYIETNILYIEYFQFYSKCYYLLSNIFQLNASRKSDGVLSIFFSDHGFI